MMSNKDVIIRLFFCFLVPSIGTNLVIALDGSQNVKPEDFDKMKNSIKDMLKIMIVSQQDSRVGVVEYSDRVDVAFHLNKYISKKDVVAALNNIQPSLGNGQNLNEVRYLFLSMRFLSFNAHKTILSRYFRIGP